MPNVQIDRRAAFGAFARMAGWTSSQSASEDVGRNVRLAQDAGERADFDLTVHRHYATFGSGRMMTWLPDCRIFAKPRRSRALTIVAPEVRGSLGMRGGG